MVSVYDWVVSGSGGSFGFAGGGVAGGGCGFAGLRRKSVSLLVDLSSKKRETERKREKVRIKNNKERILNKVV